MPALTSHAAAAPCRRTGLTVWGWIRRSVDLSRQRRALAGLPPHLLEDIGLARRDALAEAHRPFWDAPDSWRR